MAEELQVKAGKWQRDPPTKPGWYWARPDLSAPPEVLRVLQKWGGKMIFYCWRRVQCEDLTAYDWWYSEPIEPPGVG